MEIKTFFEKFNLFADAPDSVAKMRELVLYSAITGQLSEYSRHDVPVIDLLTTLSEAKKRRLGAGRQRVPSNNGPRIERTVSVPDHWAWISLSDIGEFSGGATPSKAKSVFWDGEVNWFSSKDIKREELTESELKITREGLKATGLKLYSPGCLVMVTRSGILKHTLPVSILRAEGTVNQDLKVLSPFIGGLERYLQIMLRGLNGFIIESFVKTGMTVQSLKFEEFAFQPFPIPPLAEQKRIVAKVDELMALCDQLEAQKQEREEQASKLTRASLACFTEAPTSANLNLIFHPSYAVSPADLRKSILTLAIQGKLVPQDPNDEPAHMQLERVDLERDQLVKTKRIRRPNILGPIEEDAIPFQVPTSWQWRHLADICFQITDGAHHTPQYHESGVPFLSVKDISSGTIDFCSTRFISEEAHRELCRRCKPEHGDILLTKIGTTGIAVNVNTNQEFSIFVSLALLKFSQRNLDGRYLMHLINSPFVKHQSAKNTQGVGNKNLVLRLISQFTIPIPPLAEQRRITAKVDELMALVDALEFQLATTRTTASNLLSALVAELTGTLNNHKVSVPSATRAGRRGRPRKS